MAANPTTANIDIRQCFSSASRKKSIGTKSEKRKGSKPTSPAYPARLGGYSKNGNDLLATYAFFAGAAAASSNNFVAERPIFSYIEISIQKVFTVKYVSSDY